MKTTIFVVALFIIFLFTGITATNAEVYLSTSKIITSKKDNNAPKTAYLVKDKGILSVSLMSAEESLKDNGFKASKAVIVVIGPAIHSLQKGSKMQGEVKKALKNGVKIFACELAMNYMGVKAGTLINGIQPTPNGFFKIFELENKGYLTVQN